MNDFWQTVDELTDALVMVEGADGDSAFPFDEGGCVEILESELPGFWWRGGICALSSEVIIAPDYNDPEFGPDLHRDFPATEDHWNAGIEVELRPGSRENFCRAFVACIIRAKLAKLGVRVAQQWDEEEFSPTQSPTGKEAA